MKLMSPENWAVVKKFSQFPVMRSHGQEDEGRNFLLESIDAVKQN